MSKPEWPEIQLPARLGDSRLVLRLLNESDVEAYVAAFADDPDLGGLLGVEEDPDEAAVLENIARAEEGRAAGRFLELTIADATTDAFLGSLALHQFHWRHRRVEIGGWVAPQARGQGVISDAIGIALGWLFEGLLLERVEMMTIVDNLPAQKAAEKLGFTREGVLRERDFERGRRVNLVVFGLLRSDWRKGL